MRTKTERVDLLRNIDLYPVISSEFCEGRHPTEILRSAGLGGAKITQLREKNRSDAEIYDLACEFRGICDEYGMLLIINDRIDIALASGADGVHLGQDDLPLAAARRIAPELILGSSAHSKEEALAAQEQGADYVNLGPLLPTKTKQVATPPLGLEIIPKIAPLLKIPFTVMGGLKKHHLADLSQLGATKVAMVTEVTQADDVEQKVSELRGILGF